MIAGFRAIDAARLISDKIHTSFFLVRFAAAFVSVTEGSS